MIIILIREERDKKYLLKINFKKIFVYFDSMSLVQNVSLNMSCDFIFASFRVNYLNWKGIYKFSAMHSKAWEKSL